MRWSPLAWARSNWQSFCVRLPEGVSQGTVMQAMLDAGIATRRGIMCIHREPAYASEPWRCSGDLAESERTQDTGLILPLYDELTEAEQNEVVERLEEACRTT